jgi:hypothetical protein
MEPYIQCQNLSDTQNGNGARFSTELIKCILESGNDDTLGVLCCESDTYQ